MKKSTHRLIAAIIALLFVSLTSGQTKITRPEVSETAAPFGTIETPARDGHLATFVVRKPPGKGPFPAIVYLHGTLEPRDAKKLANSLRQPTCSRFLAAGYVTAAATFRSRSSDPLTRDALEDCLAVIAHLKRMPEVDPKSVVVWGDSGGGSLALELAGETDLAAIVACEPATVLFTGMFSPDNLKGSPPYSAMSGLDIIADPQAFYTPKLQAFTREKIARIRCPILIAHGDKNAINKINNELFVPELKVAKKELEVILYPGGGHSLSHAGNPQITRKFFDDSHTFFKRHLPTQPVPMPAALIAETPVNDDARRGTRGREESSPTTEDKAQPDTARARQIFQKQRSGEKLSAEEDAEFGRIRESFAKQRSEKKAAPRRKSSSEGSTKDQSATPAPSDKPPSIAPPEPAQAQPAGACRWNRNK